ncbi:TPA: dsDNA nuclease domain-containing protein [Citrobacter pasteurii]
MSTSPIVIKDPSDSGAIASRRGYNFQDFIAASFAINMLYDKDIKAIRCEKIDDIDVIYDGFTEYVQVKATSGEELWRLTELRELNGSKTIIQKSLDSDKETNITAKFRIVSTREIRRELKHLQIRRSLRTHSSERERILKSLRVFKPHKTYLSINKNGIEYWVDNCFWEVIPSAQDVINSAQKKIHQFANSCGYAVYDYEVENIYFDIIKIVKSIADASNRTHTTEQKTLTNTELRKLISGWLSTVVEDRISTKKIYNNDKEISLSHLVDEFSECQKRSAHGFILEYARGQFRYNKLVDNLFEWMPEFILTSKELAEMDSTECYPLWKKTIEEYLLQSSNTNKKEIISEIILHMLIRFNKNSQPITGMLYINSSLGTKAFNNVHVVHNKEKNHDELWLGSAFYTKTSSLDELTSSFATFLYNKLDPDIFDKNKKRIFEAKDDSHMLPHDIDELLSSKATITNFIERYKILTLFVYDSKELESGFIENYKEKLSVEVSKIFSAYCNDISALGDDEINKLHITAYILPLEKFDILETTFLEGIKKWN